MTDFFKRPSIIAGIVGLVLGLVAFCVVFIPLLERDAWIEIELIAGALVLWITSISIIILQQLELVGEFEKWRLETKRELAEAYKEFTEVVPICIDDRWYLEKSKELASLLGNVKANNHHRLNLEGVIDDCFRDAINNIKSPKRLEFERVDEGRRIERLRSTVISAQDYIWAVTLDYGNYLLDFWANPRFREAYMAAHKANRNVKEVKRIFVLQRSVINRDDLKKHKIMTEIITEHAKSRLELRIVGEDRLLPEWKRDQKNSFLVCDNLVASESYSLLPDGMAAPGYVSYNETASVEKLKTCFTRYLEHSEDENWLKKHRF